MRLYAQTPARRSRQVLADLIAVAVIAASVWFALAVRDAIMLLAEPGRKVESAGDNLATGLDSAGEAASRVPLVGGLLKKPLQSAAEAGTGLSDAGQSLQHTVENVATLTTLALIVFPVTFVLVLWLPHACCGSGASPPPGASWKPPAAPICWPCAPSPGRRPTSRPSPSRRPASPTPGAAGTNRSSPNCPKSLSDGRVCGPDRRSAEDPTARPDRTTRRHDSREAPPDHPHR